MLVFDSIEVSPPPPTKRRANNKGTKVNPATKQPKTNIGKSRPALNPAAQETPEEERMSIALGNPQDTTDESDGEQPVKGPGSSARKRSRVSSSSDESHRSSTTNTSDGEAGDDLPLPASIAADNKRLKAKRETTLNNAALRSPRKTKTGKVRKVDTKRKLTALSQGVRDRRSGDEESDEEDFVVDDNDAIIYDTTTDEDDNEPPPTSKKQKKAAKRKGKERAVTEDEEEEEDRPVLKKKERGKGKSRKQVQRDLLATDSEEEQATRSASKPKHGKKKARRAIRSDNDDDEEEDEPVQRKKRRRRRRNSSESEEDSNNDDDDDGVDDGPDDLEILDEETVLDQKFRTLKTNESKFASLKAARDRESHRCFFFSLSGSLAHVWTRVRLQVARRARKRSCSTRRTRGPRRRIARSEGRRVLSHAFSATRTTTRTKTTTARIRIRTRTVPVPVLARTRAVLGGRRDSPTAKAASTTSSPRTTATTKKWRSTAPTCR